jgi:hypothetical protein
MPSGISMIESISMRSLKDWLLALTFWKAEARKQSFAIEHDGRIGGEHEVGEVRLGIDKVDGRAEGEQSIVQREPLLFGFLVQRAAAALPAYRIHPGIDAVAHRIMTRRAHQEAGFRCEACGRLRKRVRHYIRQSWVRDSLHPLRLARECVAASNDRAISDDFLRPCFADHSMIGAWANARESAAAGEAWAIWPICIRP